MKKIIVVFNIILILMFGIVGSAKLYGEVTAYKVNKYVFIEGGAVNSKMNYPLLSYNDNTYIALRDLANYFNYSVVWDNTSIELVRKHKDSIIKKEDTAEKIAMALIEETYSNKINEKTEYLVEKEAVDTAGVEDFFKVYVLFDGYTEDAVDLSWLEKNSDVIVTVGAETGTIHMQ